MAMMTVYNPIAPGGRGLVTHLGTTAAAGLGGAAASAVAGEAIEWALRRAGLDGLAGLATGAVGRTVSTAAVLAASGMVRDEHTRTAVQAGALAGWVAPYVARAWMMVTDAVQGATAAPKEPVGGFTQSSFGDRQKPLPALGTDYLASQQQALGADYGYDAAEIRDDAEFAL